jgi:hydrogenase nickel incorporation protein HypB
MRSVTKGEDKPLKYPTIFNSVDAAMITKAESCGSR